MTDTLITTLSLDGLRELFQLAGYRVETMADTAANAPYLRSATNGLAFDIRPGNRMAGDEQSIVDVTLMTALQVQGELPLDVVNRWNASRRFARLQLSPPFLVLSLDFSLAGGVTRTHLRGQIEIWDQLVQQFVGFLREEIAALAKTNGSAASSDHAAAVHSAAASPQHAPNLDTPRSVQ